ncbi:AAA family ATPase [Aerococcaceae bacterium zg-B36]|uniref:ParA family protein n=1 Tax=Aerococcaceae bacterium zg-252 TaxID=2796928 RepID=UPI001BD8EB50|nr:AAA family ATPase [Aerococcaceae bacterium zg-B36]
MATIITFGNFKGGTGKTTNSTMVSYTLSKLGKKTLFIDLDPQGNGTSLFLKTMQKRLTEPVIVTETLMTAIAKKDLKSAILSVNEYLDFVPSGVDLTSFPLYLEKEYPQNYSLRTQLLKSLIAPIKDDYDYVIFDVPPTVSLYTDNALVASDYTVVVLQTQERSLDGARAYIMYLNTLISNFDADFDILGILPVLLKNSSTVDNSVLDTAHEEFGDDNMLKTVIKHMERLKRYDVIGISDPDYDANADIHDKRVFSLYNECTNELLERLGDTK